MIETKQVQLFGWPQGDKYMVKMYNKCHKYIDDLTAFGWQPTQKVTERHGRTNSRYQIMARETSMPNYNELRKCEMAYEDAKSRIKTYSSAEFTTVLLLLLIFIIPGVLYLVFKSSQKSSINENNTMCKIEMQAAINKAKALK